MAVIYGLNYQRISQCIYGFLAIEAAGARVVGPRKTNFEPMVKHILSENIRNRCATSNLERNCEFQTDMEMP